MTTFSFYHEFAHLLKSRYTVNCKQKIMETVKLILPQHISYTIWLNKLGFYKDDLAVWQNRLNEIASKNTAHEVMAELEQFQNQWKIQDEQADILKHLLGLNIKTIEAAISQNVVASDHRKMVVDTEMEEKLERFEILFAGFRKNIMTFLAKWM